MSKSKTINVRDVFDIEGNAHGTGFVLQVSSRKHIIRLHFEDYFAGLIGKELHKCLNVREQTINNARARLRGEA